MELFTIGRFTLQVKGKNSRSISPLRFDSRAQGQPSLFDQGLGGTFKIYSMYGNVAMDHNELNFKQILAAFASKGKS